MSTGQLKNVIHYLRKIAGAGDATADAQLLERFIRLRDESAYRTLMLRHGPMVLGIEVLEHQGP